MLDAAAALREQATVVSKHEKDLWPRWSNWALVAVVVTGIVTIVSALNDIF